MIADRGRPEHLAFTARRVILDAMKRRPDKVSSEDAELFRSAIGEVRRIEAETAATDRPRPPPEPKRLRIDEAEALREAHELRGILPPQDGAELQSYRRPEVGEALLRQLRRGEYSVQDEIDLHHLRAADAEIMLKRFLAHARATHSHCIRIVHGKGLRSDGAPVLKMLVDRVLRHRNDVLAFASAPANQGGSGAVLVLLAPRRT